ncbi:metallophosphoesterase [Tritrichomonas foetus]|uniref:Metallophosphoesterase n=1 Tax=Tritrichomonas foetus TaxID=1144522 RepID=A0A1J4KPZ7_9EUKA|nr:metallophosphoesterase [Tritrichomonas foetus]|eukprot:OHT13186.1 metallophosphoesterase [Tritrichomonas foetus]
MPKVFALSDFHLPGKNNKTMDKYGEPWINHPEKILANVTQQLTKDDILLVPGDITWAAKIQEAVDDLQFISSLPCTVVMSEGNHDNWASKYSAVIESLPPNAVWAQRGCYRKGNVAIVSTRLWDIDGVYPWPGDIACKCADPAKIQKRELDRLNRALQQLPKEDGIIRILMVHFPPVAFDATPGPVTEIIDKYNVHFCVYGHVHGMKDEVPAVNATIGKTHYFLTSCDWLNMEPLEICDYKP